MYKRIGKDDRIKTNPFAYVDEDWNAFNFRDFELFQKIYVPCVYNGTLKNELIDFVIFNIFLSNINSFYFPAMNGEQFGDPAAMRDLYKTSLKIVEKTIKKEKKLFKDRLWLLKYRIKKFFNNKNNS